MSSTDTHFMQRCIALACNGSHAASPNPMVGAVLVKGDQVIAEGWHERAGGPHAEIMALENASDDLNGTTLYVSLEPCCHHGKTGPCTDAIKAAGITRVVFGMRDPNPMVSGKGVQSLLDAGLEVAGPVLQEQCESLNAGFIRRITTGMPYVQCKLAMSLDGRTAMASGESKWITGEPARLDVQQHRAQSDAIVTGLGTIRLDDPQLNVRLESYTDTQPLRVVVDSQLKLSPDAALFSIPGPIVLASALAVDQLEINAARFAHLEDVECLSFGSESGQSSRVDLHALLKFLAEVKQCNYVWLESGAGLAGAMLGEGLVDELICYVAPKLMGSEARPLLTLAGIEKMSQSPQLEFRQVEMIGKDCKMRCLVKK